MASVQVSGLTIYPVKSLAAVTLARAQVEPLGLAHDRRWMVVDEAGQFLTQRRLARMCLIGAQLQAAGLWLTAPGMADLSVARPSELAVCEVQVWDDRVHGLDAGDEAAAWLAEFLGQACRLVYFDERRERVVDQQYARPGDRTAFSDGFPLLLISQASLDDLNSRLAEPLPMSRFRPNLVVSGCEPFAEDGWRRLRIGDVELRVVKPCSRCIIPNIDPATADKGVEPARTLATFRKRGNHVYFGQNVIADGEGEIAVGMPVAILG